MAHQTSINNAISEATRQCVNAFSDVLLRAISGHEVPDLVILKEHHASFSIWAEELKVSPVHHAPDAKNVMAKLLQQLKVTLEAVLSHDSNSQIPVKPEENNDEDEYSSDSSLGISEDDDIEGELELATESHLVTNKHTQVIGEIISHLYRFNCIVEQQGVNAEDQRINQWALDEGQQLEHQLKRLELYMSYSLDSDFPTLQPFLRDRLVKTVIQRRKRLLYQEECSTKLDSSARGSSNSKEQELASGHPDVQDIRPYICLFQSCNTPLRQFTTKNEWINHMSSQHAQVWGCQVKGHETYLFRNPGELETHLQYEHSDIVGTDQISFLATKSARTRSDILGALATENMPEIVKGLSLCPFCNLDESIFDPKSQLAAPDHLPTAETSKETHQKAYDHISGHLKVIAHDSLPPVHQIPQPSSLHSFKIAIICGSSLTARAMRENFNEHSNMDHLFQKRIDDVNFYSLAAIGRHHVVLVHIAKMGKHDLETLFSDIRRSFPCMGLFILVDVYPITPPPSNIEINFGDVIVGDRVKESSLIRHQDLGPSSLNNKLGARVRYLLSKMRTRQVRKMVQHRMSTNLEVLSKYQSLDATYGGTEHSKGVIQIFHRREDRTKFIHTYKSERQSNGNPEPHFHFGAIGSRTSPVAHQNRRPTITVTESDVLDFDTEETGMLLFQSCKPNKNMITII